MRLLLGAAVLAAALATAACGDSATTSSGEGVVRDVRPDWAQVVIEHGDLPGLMPSMTMNFDVADPSLLEGLAPGQPVAFDVAFDGKAYTVTRLERLAATGVAAAGGSDGTLAKILAESEMAPDFSLVDQDGRPRTLSEWRGRPVLLDFVYTQCSGPCSLVTGLHVDVQRALPPAARDAVRFVSVSLDPANDTPIALGRYAKARGADLSGWSFLTGPPDRIEALLSQYGVGSIRRGNGQVEHNVVAFLIDPAGRIAKRYLGLKQDPAAIARDLAALAAPPA